MKKILRIKNFNLICTCFIEKKRISMKKYKTNK